MQLRVVILIFFKVQYTVFTLKKFCILSFVLRYCFIKIYISYMENIKFLIFTSKIEFYLGNI